MPDATPAEERAPQEQAPEEQASQDRAPESTERPDPRHAKGPDETKPNEAEPGETEPGETEPGEVTPTGRDRLMRALLRPSRGQVVVGVLLALVGFAGVTQVRFTNVDDTYSSLREQDLINVLNGLAGQSQRAEAEIARLERARDNLQSDTGQREAALSEAQQQVDTLAIMAGLVPVTGPGIKITVTEADGTVDAETMVDMIQELRTAGAEAIQINDEVRVVAQTSFEEVEGGISVDGTVVSSPYVIDVIGEPATLRGGVNFPDGPRQQFEEAGAEVKVEELASIDIEAVVEPSRPSYAQPGSAQ